MKQNQVTAAMVFAALFGAMFGVIVSDALRSPSYAAQVTLPYTYASGTVLTPTNLNGNFNALLNGVNNIDNANISADAAIALTKLSGGPALAKVPLHYVYESTASSDIPLGFSVSGVASLGAYINGIKQASGTYSLVGSTTLRFDAALLASWTVEVLRYSY
jgi:hypothetical protein